MPQIEPLQRPIDPISDIDPGSGASTWQRFKLSFEADPEFQVQMLKNWGVNAFMTPQGQVAVRTGPGKAQLVDPPGLLNDVLGDVADIAGDAMVAVPSGLAAMAGTTVGAASPVPGGAIAGGMAVGGATAGIADAVRQGIAGLFGSPRGYDVGQTATEAAMGALAEGGGHLITKGAANLYRGAKALKAPEYAKAAVSPEQNATRQAAADLGLDITQFPPGSQTSHKGVQRLSMLAEKEPYAQEYLEQSQKALRDDLELVIGDIRRSAWEHGGKADDVKTLSWPMDSGEEVQTFAEGAMADAANTWQKNINALADAAMKKMKKALPAGEDTPVDMQPIKAHLDELARRLKKGTANVNSEKIKAIEGLRKDIDEWKTVGDYLRFKPDVGEALYDAKTFGKEANGIYSALLSSLEETAERSGAAEAKRFYKDMRKMWAKKIELENDPLFRQWYKKKSHADTAPELDIARLSRQINKVLTSQSPENIKKFRQFIGAEAAGSIPPTREGKHVYGKIQQIWIDQILSKAATQGAAASGTIVQGNTLLRTLDSIGKGVLDEALGKRATDQMYAMGNLLNNETVKRHLVNNFSNTAAEQSAIEALETTWMQYVKKAGQAQKRNKIQGLVRPAGEGLPGQQYYTHGQVPSTGDVATFFSRKDPARAAYAVIDLHFDDAAKALLDKIGFSPTQAGSLWRQALQAAQQSLRGEEAPPQSAQPQTAARHTPATALGFSAKAAPAP